MTTRRIGDLIPARLRVPVLRLSAILIALAATVERTQDVVANGDTRTIHITHDRTKESASITFRRNGQYDPGALRQLSWMLRDWRTDEQVQMEPRLFDIVWQVYREVGAREPIHVVSAYRSPGTNAALRRRSRAVAEYSQHMSGKAMDFYIPEVSMARVREIAMRLQNGGVGFYPSAFNPFVHLDAGSVRSWPRMPVDQLARLFPDGRTVHIPRNGKPMPGYEQAKAQIIARGGSVAGFATYAEGGEAGPRRSLWASLFGGGDDEDSEFYQLPGARGGGPARVAAASSYAPSGNSDDAGTRSFFAPAPMEEPSRAARGPQFASASAASAPPPGLERFGADAADPAVPFRDAPMPPRRPGDLGPLLAATGVSAARLAAGSPAGSRDRVGEGRGEMRPAARPAPDDRAALRQLFDMTATRVSPERRSDVRTSPARPQPVAGTERVLDPGARVLTTFSSAALEQPLPGAFSGPAVMPLPILR